MANRLGIQEVKDVVSAVIGVAEVVETVADGFQLSDLGKIVGVVKVIKPAVAALKSGQVIPELKDLDDNEKFQLKEHVATLDLKDDNVEAVIEKALNVAVDLAEILQVLP